MLYLDFIHPYLLYVLVIGTTIFIIQSIFTRTSYINIHKNKIIRIVMIVLLITQIIRYMGIFFPAGLEWNIGFMNFKIHPFSIRSYMPFYMCRISVVVLLIYTITKSKVLEPFLFYWGALGLAGVLYPNGPFTNSVNLTETFYIDHILLTVTPFFLVVYQGYKPTFKHALYIAITMFIMLTMFIPINNWVDADYFYISNQSILAVLFGVQPKLIFILVHSLAALGFFSLYYNFFKGKEFYIEQ